MTEEPSAQPIEPDAEQEKKAAIAPRFDKEELDKIDKYRGERTKTEFVYDSVIAQLKVQYLLETEKKKRSVVLKHECGKSYDVQRCGDDVFLICKKCHKSRKIPKAEYDAMITEAAKQ